MSEGGASDPRPAGRELPADLIPDLAEMMTAWVERHPPPGSASPGQEASGQAGPGPLDVTIDQIEVLAGYPMPLVAVKAEISGPAGGETTDRSAHAVIGFRPLATVGAPLRAGDEPVLGTMAAPPVIPPDLLSDASPGASSRPAQPAGAATAPPAHEPAPWLAIDALAEAETAVRTFKALMADHEPIAHILAAEETSEIIAVSIDERWRLTTYSWPPVGENPAVTLLMGLDRAGFNHLLAPLARWQHDGRDLGVVQEIVPGVVDGWALALTSVRDLHAAGGAPADAGGDFAPEAESLGTMVARMHLALAVAFGTTRAELDPWGTLVVMRTHGDLHLGRVARSDHGWLLADCSPGGCVGGSREPVLRSPCADLGDVLWSFGRVAEEVVPRSAQLASAWDRRNGEALLRGYLATPGIEALMPTEAETVRALASRYRAERALMAREEG